MDTERIERLEAAIDRLEKAVQRLGGPDRVRTPRLEIVDESGTLTAVLDEKGLAVLGSTGMVLTEITGDERSGGKITCNNWRGEPRVALIIGDDGGGGLVVGARDGKSALSIRSGQSGSETE